MAHYVLKRPLELVVTNYSYYHEFIPLRCLSNAKRYRRDFYTTQASKKEEEDFF